MTSPETGGEGCVLLNILQICAHNADYEWAMLHINERQWAFGRKVAKNSLEWVIMVEPSILNVFIKIKHYFVKSTYNHLHVHAATESYQPITFVNRCHAWNSDTLAKAHIVHTKGMAETSKARTVVCVRRM